ncbi:hypothetical protein CTEST_00345 [Corynebacterium testudinoris]|uniref:Uncharacterized protein n=1 Tax=Corynebacterium testudinoris TaxID=136857 RepID=A0A0G3H2A0_9CORY|nr:hypothetical protein CTEST_00345 [Corynebacterium testudinoris]
MDGKTVIKAFASFVVGVLAYCAIIAPLTNEGSYGSVVFEKLTSIGIAYTAIAIVLCAIWLAAIALIKKKR